MDKEMMKGSIDMLLLSLLTNQDLYGYEMTQKLHEFSEESYLMSEGTLYPALKRIERKEWVTSYWSQHGSTRRKYYHLSDKGEKELERKRQEWQSLNNLLDRINEGASYE
ncbi:MULTISPECIES: PadR family transcriptional regulator [Gracilibacillus]|uniref:PadR family transcriptional regulator n=1 Tax=Gracilibacillus TaxID=74385 RepID=UPI0008260A05|nr:MULTISPECIES: PadR family transcriptional regulator [Gracilibacillus]